MPVTQRGAQARMKCNINRLNEEQETRSNCIVADLTNGQRCRLRAFLRNSGQERVDLTSASAVSHPSCGETNLKPRDFE